jgi:hypothetical protein
MYSFFHEIERTQPGGRRENDAEFRRNLRYFNEQFRMLLVMLHNPQPHSAFLLDRARQWWPVDHYAAVINIDHSRFNHMYILDYFHNRYQFQRLVQGNNGFVFNQADLLPLFFAMDELKGLIKWYYNYGAYD